MISSVIVLLMFGVVVLFVIQPLFLKEKMLIKEDTSGVSSLEQRKKILYRQIKELEMDHQIGNLNEEDFIQSRNELKAEVSTLIKQMKDKK